MSEGRKPIPGFPGYTINAGGDVFGPDGNKLSPRKDDDGYLRVDLRKDGVRKTRFVHTLIELAKGNSGTEVDHKDGNRTNNTPGNTETVSHDVNMDRMATRNGKNTKS